MLKFGNNDIYAKQIRRMYTLEPKVERLFDFLRSKECDITHSDVIKFLVDELYLLGAHRRAEREKRKLKPIHEFFVVYCRFDEFGEMPRAYQDFHDLLKDLFNSEEIEIAKATPYIVEQLVALALERQGLGEGKTNFTFFLKDGKKIIAEYIDDSGKQRYHEEVDVVLKDGTRGGTLGECKQSVDRLQKAIPHNYDFLTRVADLIEGDDPSQEINVLFAFPTDRANMFKWYLQRVKQRKREVLSFVLKGHQQAPIRHAIDPPHAKSHQ